MAFVLRRPFSLTSALSTTSRHVSKTWLRSATSPSFQRSSKSSSPIYFTSKSTKLATTLGKAPLLTRPAFRRSYNQESYQLPRPDTANLTQRLIYGAGIFGGTLIAINLVFNRETREDGGMPLYERSYLNDTFLHTGLGIGIIGVTASAMHRSGWSYRLMAMNPWAVIGVSLAASIGTMYATFATSPDKLVSSSSEIK